MNYIEGKVRYYLLLLTSDFHLIDRITQNEILSYRTYVLPFYANHTHYLHHHTGTHYTLYHTLHYTPIILIIPTLHYTHPHLSYKLQVTACIVSRDKWSSVGLADMRRFTITAIIVVVISQIIFKKKKTIDRSKPCGDCVASHHIKRNHP